MQLKELLFSLSQEGKTAAQQKVNINCLWDEETHYMEVEGVM